MEVTVSNLLMLRRYINSKLMRKCALIKDYALCLGNISKDFTIHDMKKKQN